MDKKEAQALYQKYVNGTCSPEEIALLEIAFLHYLRGRKDMPSERQIQDAGRQMKQVIYNHVAQSDGGRKRHWYRWAAAAVLVLALGVGYGLWKIEERRQAGNMIAQSSAEPDISPGGKRATLTLEDGQTIELSADQTGIVIDDGITYTDGSDVVNAGNTDVDSAKQGFHFQGAMASHLVLQTPKGGEYHVILQDGTEIWLNAESTLRYPLEFDRKDRVVQLSGEAYFEVDHDERPFAVVTDLGEVNVYGTAFNVKAYPDEYLVQTTLVTGKVAFATMRMTVMMNPGELAVADASGHVEKRKTDPNRQIGWRNGRYVFRERRLEDIMRELARWYDVEVYYQDEHVKDIAFTGDLLRYDSITAFLRLLQRTGEVSYRIEGMQLILFSK
ncbi:FecR family protein [Parapedobacter tibetensis]|uniref:FecR family protein n=1 Tax=Parapedobacter tibetensis TaxID=2972951 RepID=UPI00214D3EAA|nr:FecR family protein [Parapedobacter tibetensis]